MTHPPDPSGSLAVHVPSSDDLPGIVRNLDNLRNELGPDTPIEVVAHGAGLDLVLSDSAVAGDVERLIEAGIGFDACANTMSRRSVDAAQLVGGVTVVPAGLAHLARLQWKGFACVRP